MKVAAFVSLLVGTGVSAHWCWPTVDSAEPWSVVRKTDNFNTRNPLKNVTDPNFTCYNMNGGEASAPSTYTVAAGANITFQTDNSMYHIGVLNVYMAKAPSTAASFDGKGDVWFKIFQITGVADCTGAEYPEFPATDMTSVTVKIPPNVPSGEYLLRTEYIALHDAYYFGGAQFYIGCAQLSVTGGGNGTPGPLVAIPGVYTGNEPGIVYDVYRYPTQTSYIQPGPAVWSG